MTGSSSAISVLIVDDNELVGHSLARCCDTSDISVIAVVSNGADALAAAREHGPDVVLMDYRLGAENGISLARQLLGVDSGAKVLLMTGDPNARIQIKAREAGCVGCVGKTVHVATALPDMIRRVYSGESV
jgi:DNA-binding NarL/FixJ family response regulator